MPFTKFRGGKLPPKRLLKIPALGDYLDRSTTWPDVPPMGWEFAVPAVDLNVLGNDRYGCCAESGAMHLIQAQTANASTPLVPTTAETLALYTALTGFNPSDPSTDQGTVLTDLLAYWKNTGITVGGTVHKIAGYASLDISSLAQLRYAAYTFGGAYLGIQCPEKCEQDTSNWNFAPGLPIAGGHCIIQAGEGADGGKIGSWGKWIPASNQFLLGYLEEGYVVWSQDWLDSKNLSPTGLDLAGLSKAGAAL